MTILKSDKKNPKEIKYQLQSLTCENIHPNVSQAKTELLNALDRYLDKGPKEIYPGIQEKFSEAVKSQVKSCILAIQTVIKRVKQTNENQNFVRIAKDVTTWLEILDIESFQIGLESIIEMSKFCENVEILQDQIFVFEAYLAFWNRIYNFAQKLFSNACEYTCHCAQALKIILDYQYSEGKDEEEQESKDDGQKQDGCGLGDGDGGEATTKDVESEDIFDSAEKPQNSQEQNENKDEEQEPRKEEDGFEVDNVEDENPQAPDEEEQRENPDDSEDENDEKEEELEAEEGKADEIIDEDLWDEKDEEKENDKENNDENTDSKEEKGAHENPAEDQDKNDQNEPPIEEDENKRQRKDEQFEDQTEEIDMNDETYGQNEPPEPEDLDLDDDDQIMGDDDDKPDDENELPPEEDLRLPDFEETPEDENKNEDEEEKQEITKSTGGNAGQDESKPEEQETEQLDQLEDTEAEDKGKEMPNKDKNDDDTKNETEGMISNEIEQNEEKIGEQEQNLAKEEDKMVTEDIDETKEVPITEETPEEDEQENETKTLENQEFAKDQKNDNTINALDAMDVDDKPDELQKIKEHENTEQREGKSLDLSKLQDAITVDTENVERNTETIFGRTVDQSLISKGEDHEMLALDDIETNLEDSAASEDVQKWLQLTHETSELTQNLTEQLRLILEATKATRFKGDYKSGKRINMRKVIPFIASNYRKDKIWLRRTKPSKREYNVIVAVDDSTSMRVHNVNQLVDKSLAILCQTLSSLEVGKLGLIKFGKDTEIVHHLQVCIYVFNYLLTFLYESN